MTTDSARVLFFLASASLCSAVRLDLGGQWSVAGGGDNEITIINATVPGGIFTDLMNNGEIGDIFAGTGDLDYRWVGESNWTYSRTFTVDEELLAHTIVLLIFEGLDTFAAISINGVEIGTTENMFVRYSFSAKQYLQVGANEIEIRFTSAVAKAAALAQDPANEYVIPPECPPSEYKGICYVNRIRKTQSSFSWDWGPALASVGIWKDVYLEAFNNAIITHLVATSSKDPESGMWLLVVTSYIDVGIGGESHDVYGRYTIDLQTNRGTKSISKTIKQPLRSDFSFSATTYLYVLTEDVDAWWPNGYGAQNLYNLTVSYIGETETTQKFTRVGFREVELVQEEVENGLTFYFKINGQPIFAKGANEIPINILPEKSQDPDTIRRVLQTARDTHMNMLRIWGGGNYESDYFYDLADEYGILIWQDFMFASAMYPADSDFLSNVTREVSNQVRRIASHPSVILWAGNNENEAVLSSNYFGTDDNFTLYKADYVKLYAETISSALNSVLFSTPVFYVTSSPSNGLATVEEGYVATNPGDSMYGDVHFYDYTSDSWSPSTFPIPRFASEYGYQSYPSIESWLTATDNVDDLNLDSDFMNHRQRHPGGTAQILDLIGQQLQLPDSSSENYVKALFYFSQIVQAQSIKVETEHYRSFKGRYDANGQGNTMGALYWQLNDVWLGPTWSGMDYTGRWKMLQYFTQEFFNPLLVTGQLTAEDDLEIYAILDQLELPDVDTKVVLQVYTWSSLDSLVSIEFPVTLDPSQAVLVTTVNAPTAFILAGCGDDYAVAKAECFFYLQLMDQDNNELAPINYVFPEKLKNSNLPGATVEITSVDPYNEDNTVFEIVVITNWVALFVWLDSHEISGRFSQNGFLQVVSTKTVYFTSDEPIAAADLTNVLTVTHLLDSAYSKNSWKM